MYAQKIEGDSWQGEKLDQAKIDKMSSTSLPLRSEYRTYFIDYRSADRATLRTDASRTKKGQG